MEQQWGSNGLQVRQLRGETTSCKVAVTTAGEESDTTGDSNKEGGRSREVTVELQLGSSSKERTVTLGQVAAAEKIQWHCSRW